jgi:hypothetical protein
VRIVCANTLGYALARADRVDAQRTFRCRHTARFHTRLHEAPRVMQLTVNYAEQCKRLGDRLALEPITEAALRGRVLDRLFMVDDSDGDLVPSRQECPLAYAWQGRSRHDPLQPDPDLQTVQEVGAEATTDIRAALSYTRTRANSRTCMEWPLASPATAGRPSGPG